MIVPLNSSHIDSVVALHRKSLTGLLKDLGLPALRAWYRAAIESCHSIGFVCIEEAVVDGFVFGSSDPASLRGEMRRKNWPSLIIGTLVGSLAHPSTVRALAQSISSRKQDYDAHAAELTYLAVAANSRRSGIGKKLVDVFEDALKLRGIPAYELSVDQENERAQRFYSHLGFYCIGLYEEFGTKHVRLRKNST